MIKTSGWSEVSKLSSYQVLSQTLAVHFPLYSISPIMFYLVLLQMVSEVYVNAKYGRRNVTRLFLN